MSTSTESWHGTRSGYNGRACRCEHCTEAQRAYQARRLSDRDETRRAKKAAYMKNWRASNHARVIAQERERRAADPEKYRAMDRASNAKKRGNREHLARTRDNRYNLAPGQFDKMLAAQDARCAICSNEFGDKTPHVDHDHSCCPGQKSCGQCVRALLCSPCNHAIGLLGDDPARVRDAAAYLERAR